MPRDDQPLSCSFTPPILDWPFRSGPELDQATGQTEEENRRHFVARRSLVAFLLDDRRTQAVFDSLDDDLGLHHRAQAIAILREQVLSALGLEHTSQLASKDIMELIENLPDVDTTEPPSSSDDQLPYVICRFSDEAEDFRRVVSEIPPIRKDSALKRLAWFVVGELHIGWPWVIVELWESYWVYHIFSLSSGLNYQKALPSVSSDPAAPRLSLKFSTKPGESVGESIRRLSEETRRAMVVLEKAREAASLPRGKRTDDETTERYVDWLYRAKIRVPSESISSLARRTPCDRATVQYGIKQAHRLLKLGYR